MLSAAELELFHNMYVSLLSLEATTRRISELMDTSVKPKREPRPRVELTEAEWIAMLVDKYPNYDVPQMLRDAEAHYLSQDTVFTRSLGVAWLRRQKKWNKPTSAPPQKKGLVL